MPKKKHHNKTFTCSASNIADRSRRSVSILLYVRYAPSVRLTPSQGLLREGETVQFKCHAHANPAPLEYSWFVDGQRANGFESDFFLIANISQSYHNAIVKCEVRNEIGKSEETETIQVRCKWFPAVVSSIKFPFPRWSANHCSSSNNIWGSGRHGNTSLQRGQQPPTYLHMD